MRPGQQNKRLRGRGRKGPNPLSRSYESNGPDVKIRGTAQHIAEKYTTLARDASASGDRVMAENYLQHAEHYGRIVAAAQGTFQLQRDENDMDEDGEDEGDEDGLIDVGGFSNGQGQDTERAPQNYQPAGQDVRDGGNGNGSYNNNRQRDRNQDNRNQGQDNRGNDNRGNRDGNRQGYQARDNQARDNRDGNRDNNRNGEGRERFRDRNENGRNENGRADQNRTEQPRAEGHRNDTPREGRERNNNRGEFRENRDRSTPNGVGPQPFVNEIRSPVAVSETPTTVSQAAPVEDVVRVEPAFQPPLVEREDVSEAVSQVGDAVSVENAPRRRGRPRRPRLGEGTEVSVAGAPQPQFDAPVAPAPVVEARAPQPDVPPAEAPRPAEPVVGDGDAAVETKAKRKPGRPRKKKTDDEGGGSGEDGGDHLPAFLLA